MSGALLAGIELGGTKSIATLAAGREIVASRSIPTTDPDTTLAQLHDQLQRWWDEEPFAALGIASFGPIGLAAGAPAFGHMLRTPKPGWSGAPVAQALTAGLDCPWRLDTDVNAAALAEYRWGAGAGCDSLCYLTIGTGVGGGLLVGGRPVHGAMHPEIGHLHLRRAAGDTFNGTCAFHGDCIEGLISGPALERRFAAHPSAVPDSDPVWHHVADDLAELAGAILLMLSAERILIGGGVAMARPFLIPLVQDRLVANLADYLPFIDDLSVERILGLASLGAQAGPLGSIALALDAMQAPAAANES